MKGRERQHKEPYSANAAMPLPGTPAPLLTKDFTLGSKLSIASTTQWAHYGSAGSDLREDKLTISRAEEIINLTPAKKIKSDTPLLNYGVSYQE